MNIADIVISLCGRDAGKRFIVIATEGQYCLIADGKGRRLEKPKKKKNKHLKFESTYDSIATAKLLEGEKVSNSEIRKALAEYISSVSEQEDTTKSTIADKGGVPICQKMT